ncbi:MAG: type II secretion system minor pseudopilin GspI [Gammaproteobacteria bacterium]|nr:type II secretion system minor pseudopilin GspI [Gammaproteobacteria bacterium]
MKGSASSQGFTLVEVLVALLVVAVGLGAVFLSLNQHIYNATYLREKTLASWVAENRMTTVRLAASTPEVAETTGDEEMGEIRWRWTQKVSETGVANLSRIDISVSNDLHPDTSLINLSGFVGAPVPTSNADGNWAGAPSGQE